MTVIFPKWTNRLPPVLGLGAAAAAFSAIFTVWFWFSPKHTDVGYSPVQPIAYSHKLHAGQLAIDCRYCHRMVEEGPHATIPDSATCMGCHLNVKKESPKLQPLVDVYGGDVKDGLGKAAIPWVKVHLLPDYAYFSHAVHLRASIGCASCHGRIDQMEVVRQAQPLSMSWCLECHRDAAPHVRPADVAPTAMSWQPTEQTIAAAQLRLDRGELNPPIYCSACHR